MSRILLAEITSCGYVVAADAGDGMARLGSNWMTRNAPTIPPIIPVTTPAKNVFVMIDNPFQRWRLPDRVHSQTSSQLAAAGGLPSSKIPR
jgi:hypothetical protein